MITGTAAIRGEQPDSSGETFGVVGISSSPDGAGLGAANTSGGPDLVLDGAVPAELSDSGLNRPSASAQSFSFGNSGGGGLTLDVDGVEVVTTATDSDTLAGLSCSSGQVAKRSGSTWVCAPDLDTDTDTLAGLACPTGQIAKRSGASWICAPDDDDLGGLTCGGGQVAKWNGSVWACADDDDTSYSFGSGLTVDGSQVVIDPAAFSVRITRWSSVADMGRHTSFAIGADGLGLISCYNDSGGQLIVRRCTNVLCTSTDSSAVDSIDDVGKYTSVAIGADGLPLVSYYDADNTDLKVAHLPFWY